MAQALARNARAGVGALLRQGMPSCSAADDGFGWLRHQHAARQPSTGVVPAHILEELAAIERQLGKASRMDGRQRLQLSASALPFGLPQHELEPGLPPIEAHARTGAGKTFTKWLRKAGRVPAHVHSLPGDQRLLVHVLEKDAIKLVRQYGRNGCQARVFALQLVDPAQPGVTLGALRVKPTAVRVNAITQRLEDMDMVYCPQDRVVLVDVPVKLVNDDLAPGIKKGGWMNITKRLVRYKALGRCVPPFVEVNVRGLDLEQGLAVRDMPIPQGTKLYEKDYDATVVLCTTDVGKD